MHVLVCGSREYKNSGKVFGVLDFIHSTKPITRVIHGAAMGADTFGMDWAKSRGVVEQGYEPDWRRYGNHAGNVRNQQMLDSERIDLVVAFATGRGTRDMVRRATDAKISVVRIR
ncbi:DUF2493 domain-containing protein [Phaeobacter gallaeciensis]|uniref:DUF2493 domain-containing protein n=1 Tax=Phaeobacter gallaeciensis TaxID=60890 RepID=UPI002380B414|nr:DUF2493 domain-containing protein [Phaeobacter gallaeciensis]MDE4297069.1 DUF2493 domain-containing protein [Phaeobacter gallaeciensis]